MIPCPSIRKDGLIEVDTMSPPGGTKKEKPRGNPPGKKPDGPGAQKKETLGSRLYKGSLYHAYLNGLNLLLQDLFLDLPGRIPGNFLAEKDGLGHPVIGHVFFAVLKKFLSAPFQAFL